MNVKKAKEAQQFAGVLARSCGKPSKVYVPASPLVENNKISVPRCAEVSILREGRIMTVNCQTRPVNGDGESSLCLGMGHGNLCYHSLAAIFLCASENGLEIDVTTEENGSDGKICAAYGGANAFYRVSRKKLGG